MKIVIGLLVLIVFLLLVGVGLYFGQVHKESVAEQNVADAINQEAEQKAYSAKETAQIVQDVANEDRAQEENAKIDALDAQYYQDQFNTGLTDDQRAVLKKKLETDKDAVYKSYAVTP